MFARGAVYLHAAHLPVPKTLAAKSSVSTSSKLIETKGLQLQHFGHLRKTGGWGSYRLVHTLPVTSLQYCAAIAWDGAKTESRRNPSNCREPAELAGTPP